MHARPLLFALLFAALVLPAAASQSRESTPSPRLRGSQCLDPDFARSFNTVDNRRLLVDAGRHKYLVHVAPSCWNLDHTPVIVFRGDPIAGRVCGSAFDKILVRGGTHPCSIERMELLDPVEYKALLNQGKNYRKARRVERAKKRD